MVTGLRLIEILLKNPRIAPELLGNPSIPKEAKDWISSKTDIYIPKHSVYYQAPYNIPQLKVLPEAEINSYIIKHTLDWDRPKYKYKILKFIHEYVLPDKSQKYLLKNGYWWIYLASNPSINIETQKFLANSGDKEIAKRLSQNPSLAPSIAYKLFYKSDKVIRDLLLQHANLKKLFKNYTSHSSAAVRSMVAINPHLPVKLQWKLANDPDILVRLRLAANPLIDEEVAQSLALLDIDSVCYTLAMNTTLWKRLF